jgi:hypothetical protein
MMFITENQQDWLDAAVGDSDRDDFVGSDLAQKLREQGVDAEAAYDLDLVPPGDPDDPDEPANEELVLLNPETEQGRQFNHISKIVHDYHWSLNEYKNADHSVYSSARFREQMSRTPQQLYSTDMRNMQSALNRSDADVNKFGIEFGGNLNYNMMSGLINWAKIDDMPAEVALATAALLEEYEQLPNWTWSGTSRMLRSLGTDAFTYIGGIGGIKIIQQLLRTGGTQAVKNRLMKVALRGAGLSALGAEGSAYAAFGEYMAQRLKHGKIDEANPFNPDWATVATVGGFGFGMGALAGGAAMVPQAARAVKGAFNQTVETAMRGDTLTSGVGALPENPNRAGTELAQQPDAMGFRSGLINMLDALPESATGEQMLATLSDPQRLGEYGAKAEEISLTGLDKFLREAEGPVTKSDIAAHLEANRVELDEARGEGSARYRPGQYDPFTREVYDFDDLISSRYGTSEYEFERGSISGFNEFDEFDDNTVDVVISKQFDIFDPEKNKSVLDEIELTINNNSAYFDGGEGEAAREAATEIIGQIRNEISDNGARLSDRSIGEIKNLYKDLNSNLAADEVFDAMESRASYDLYDVDGHFSLGKFDSEDEAEHRAAEYIESIDVDGDAGPGGRFSSITFPTNDGGRPENYKEVRLLMPEDDKRFPQTGVSQHFEQNTFAHYRSTDRQVVLDQPDQPDMFGGADPKDAMFVEEIQSDLMQAGGKRGYKTEEVMDTWKAGGTEIHERMKDKLHAFGYGEDLKQQTKDADILTNLTGLYEGFSRMMKGKDRVEAIKKYLDKLNSVESQAANAIVQTIAELPKKKMSDEQLYDAFNMFVATLASFRGSRNEVAKAVIDLSPKRYGSKMVDSDGYDRGLEFLEKLTSKDLRDFYRARDKAIIAKSGLPDIPLKKNWVELTMKRAIYDAVEEGKTMIAFPNHAETVGAIEYGGRPATGAIKRLYEADIPKLLQKLAKQTGGEIKTGALAESIKHREYDRWMQGNDTLDDSLYPNQGSVIILDLSKNPQKVKREGFAIPVIAGGATAATAIQQPRENQQQNQ